MKKIYSLLISCLITSAGFSQSSTNPVYLNYSSTLDWATYISSTGSSGNQPSMFFHLPYVGTTGNAVFEWDADDSGTRKAIYRFEASSDRIFEINGWNDGSSSDLWFGDDNNDKFYIADDGRVGIGNNAVDISNTSLDQFVVGDGVGSRGIVVYHGTNNDGGYAFANPSGNLTGRILYDYSESEIKFQYGYTDLITYGSNQIDLLKDTDVSGKLTLASVLQMDNANPTLQLVETGVTNNNWDIQVNNGDFQIIKVDDARSTFEEAFFISDQSQIGIGTTNPSRLLHVNGSTTDVVSAFESTDSGTQIALTDNSGSLRLGTLSNGGFALSVGGDASSTTGANVFEAMRVTSSGNVGIGTSNPDQALTVKGKIHSEEIIVDLNVPGPDYVFEEDYDLPTLSEIEAFIKANKHLPEVPTAKEMEANGITLGEMNMLLLKKIEELTLHTIQQETNASKQQELIQELMVRIEKLESQNNEN